MNNYHRALYLCSVCTLKVLIAALNWGLGHATRCIPLIRALRANGHEVILASDGSAYYLLQAEFPELECVRLPSYRIRYEGNSMVRNMMRRLPRILYAMYAEHRAVRTLVRERGITHIISDNRYGCYSPHAANIFITHQLHLRVPGVWLGWVVNGMMRRYLDRFDEIWVPDMPHENDNLSGALSHPPSSEKVQYVGLLSRMSAQERSTEEPEYDVAVILSGPEPQRSHLEQRIIEQLLSLPYKCIIVQGKPRVLRHQYLADHIEMVSYLTSDALQQVIRRSEMIVCRSGYSSLMDLAVLGKKALLIPTPGQTEQEYLAERLSEKGWFVARKQEEFHLDQDLETLQRTTGFKTDNWTSDHFMDVLARLQDGA